MGKFGVGNKVVDVTSVRIQVLGVDCKGFEGSFGGEDFDVVACI